MRLLSACLPVLSAGIDVQLEPPFLVQAGDAPIDVAGGHSAPFFHDVDGDGLDDLLVGQFEGGHLRVYRNVGERGAPRFAEHELLQAGGSAASVPYG
jgi:hypothetical protein